MNVEQFELSLSHALHPWRRRGRSVLTGLPLSVYFTVLHPVWIRSPSGSDKHRKAGQVSKVSHWHTFKTPEHLLWNTVHSRM